MINISIKQKDKLIYLIEVKGHANYAEEGYDIICASVSSIVQTAVLGLVKVLFEKIEYTVEERDGYLKCKLDNPNDKTEIILQTMKEGLKDIESQFPQYMKLMEA